MHIVTSHLDAPVVYVRQPASQEGQPYTRLCGAVLADLYVVRDLMAGYEARGKPPPQGMRRQQANDQQWISNTDERSPFSFGWVCQQLGLNAKAVRRTYLSGPLGAPRPQEIE